MHIKAKVTGPHVAKCMLHSNEDDDWYDDDAMPPVLTALSYYQYVMIRMPTQ